MATTTTDAVPSIDEPFVDRNRKVTGRWMPILLRVIKRLFEVEANVTHLVTVTDTQTKQIDTISGTVDGLTTTVSTQQSVINGIEAHWGVSIDSNGIYRGGLKLDSSASTTSLNVYADEFKIYQPGAPGKWIQAFVVGSVGGVTTVGINGNLVVDQTITTNQIAANAITAAKIAADTITANQIAANAITSSELSANSITAGKIAANAVTAGTIAANAVTAGTIAANAVTSSTIAANTITSGMISASAITSDAIAANAIVSGKIATGAVTAGTIAANAVTASNINVSSLSAIAANCGTITAGKMQSTDGKMVMDLDAKTFVITA